MSPSNSEEDVVNGGNGNDGDSPMDAYEGNESACGVNMSLGPKEVNVKSENKSETISDNGKVSSSLPKTKSQRKRNLPESIMEMSNEKRVLKLLYSQVTFCIRHPVNASLSLSSHFKQTPQTFTSILFKSFAPATSVGIGFLIALF